MQQEKKKGYTLINKKEIDEEEKSKERLSDQAYKNISETIKDLKFMTPEGILRYLKNNLTEEERHNLWEQLAKLYERKGMYKKAERWYKKVEDYVSIAKCMKNKKNIGEQDFIGMSHQTLM